MSLLPALPGTLNRIVEDLGAPLPLWDENANKLYMLLEINFTHLPDGFRAQIPGIRAIGEGDTKEEAALALREALQSHMTSFAW